MMKRKKTERQALESLAGLCSRSEHCTADLLDKLRRWNIPSDACSRIMNRLVSDGYVDDRRYAELFVSEKVNISHWGRRKIEQALKMKHIAGSVYGEFLSAVSDEEWLSHLRPLLKEKASMLPPLDERQRSMKLIRFALSRGFDMNLIRICLADNDLPDDADFQEEFED